MDGKNEAIIFNVNGVDELCKMFAKVNGKLRLLGLVIAAYAIFSEQKTKKQDEKIHSLEKQVKELKDPKGE